MPFKPNDWHRRFSQQAGWTSATRKYLFDLAGISDASAILDVGCGTGYLTSEISEIGVPFLVGIDISSNFILQAAANTSGCHFSVSDAHQLPFKSSTFDISFCHFVLMWVENPLQVLIQMARVTKPGCAVIAIAEPDYGGRIDFPPDLEIINHWQTLSLQEQGADPHFGRKMKYYFHQAGLNQIEVGVMGAQWSMPPDKEELESEWAVIQHDLSFLRNKKSGIMLNNPEELKQMDMNAFAKGERTLYVPTFYALGRVPGV